ncbi:hypothetical protein BY996DRAFT_7116911 [Phakopsora pachyrhizi]|uniref:Tyrosine--tRNA ligase n=1 Tax=Phakopsora pachyrhizi TaxID=170000 RepID=A0AAV0BQN6_PHAPC|nr:hypothetical protein BY996DRAFT_7116911 [Phakopsora pachyrhizi]CAH7688356.1 hypothetical protein PPACK8108_LOCUS23310 [Phakopsora pachyrhizi]
MKKFNINLSTLLPGRHLRQTSRFLHPRPPNLSLTQPQRLISISNPCNHPHSLRVDIVNELEKRCLVAQVTSRAIRQHLMEERRTVYLGIDPTARSLHLGNLLALVALFHFAINGHMTIILLGGATGAVGDPSGRTSERMTLSQSELETNLNCIEQQIRKILLVALEYAYERIKQSDSQYSGKELIFPIVKNNLEWTEDVTLLDFLNKVGRNCRISSMLARDSVKQRMNSKAGISFTEFAYQLLQAYDFSQLHSRYGCSIQLGGSDQYGNIMSGIELMARIRNHQAPSQDLSSHEGDDAAYGLTVPLLTSSKGEKFGKSAGNAVWLDPTLTPPVDLYQVFLRVPDTEALSYLKMLTFVPLSEIEDVGSRSEGRKREAQKLLAQEVVMLVHGAQGLQQALTATEILFPGNDKIHMPRIKYDEAFKDSTHLVRMDPSDVFGSSIGSVAVTSGLCKSKREANTLLENAALTVNHKQTDSTKLISQEDFVCEKYMIMMRGKGAYKVIVLEGIV